MHLRRVIVENIRFIGFELRLDAVVQGLIVLVGKLRRRRSIGIAGVARRLRRLGRSGAEIVDLVDDIAEALERFARRYRRCPRVQEPIACARFLRNPSKRFAQASTLL